MAMANIELKCSECGRTYTASKKCFNRTEANSWEAYMRDNATGTCPTCYDKLMQDKRDAERSARAAKTAEAIANCTLDLPELIGSEKQIKWAGDIRERLIATLDDYGMQWDLVMADLNSTATDARTLGSKEQIKKLLDPSAKNWIEARGTKIYGASVR